LNFLSYRPFTEIEFLSRQTMVFANGARTNAGTLAAIVPADGLTFVLLGASIFYALVTGAAGNRTAEVQLQNNTSIRDTLGSASNFANTGGFGAHFTTHVRGDTLDGDGVLEYRLQVIAVNPNMTIRGALYGYLRNT